MALDVLSHQVQIKIKEIFIAMFQKIVRVMSFSNRQI